MEAVRTTFSLRWKILFWFFVNLLVLSAAIFVFLRAQLHLDLNALIAGPTGDRLEAIAGPLAAQLYNQPKSQWGELLEGMAGRWRGAGVQTGWFRDAGTLLGGDLKVLPGAVQTQIVQHERRHHGPPVGRDGDSATGRGPQPARRGEPRRNEPPPDDFDGDGPFFDGLGMDGEPPPGPPEPPGPRREQSVPRRGMGTSAVGTHDKFILRVGEPGRYWIGVHLGEMETPGSTNLSPSVTLVFASDSLRGGGLLFDYYPWLGFAGGLVVVSVLIWLPFVTGVIGSLGRMMHTAEAVAQGSFRPAHTSRRGDELGRLSRALAHMGARLEEAAHGQKRFLGDTAHELLSPLARMEMALSILEQHPPPESRDRYIAQALEDVRYTSTLVQDLLAFAKAGLRVPGVALASVRLEDLVDQSVSREAAGGQVVVAVPEDLYVCADPELLVRALANTVRNAVRYAGHVGPVVITAGDGVDAEGAKVVTLQVADRGPGVPPEELDRLFEPFFRPETARTRETGGAGLGLAIVKSCVEACGGKVAVRNLTPTGLQVTFVLAATPPAPGKTPPPL